MIKREIFPDQLSIGFKKDRQNVPTLIFITNKLHFDGNKKMEFQIRFKSENGHSVEQQCADVGLDFVDQVRRNLDLQNLDCALFEGLVGSLKSDPSLKVDETLARKSGVFFYSYRQIVWVQAKSLTRFVEMKFTVDRSQEDGAITRVTPYFEVNNEALLEAWEHAGFPLQWDIE